MQPFSNHTEKDIKFDWIDRYSPFALRSLGDGLWINDVELKQWQSLSNDFANRVMFGGIDPIGSSGNPSQSLGAGLFSQINPRSGIFIKDPTRLVSVGMTILDFGEEDRRAERIKKMCTFDLK